MKAELAAAAGARDVAIEAFVRAANEGSRDEIWAQHCPLALEIRRRGGEATTGAFESIRARAAALRDSLGSTG